MSDLDRSRILKLALIIEIIVLLGTAATALRDYQDSWILEGLEIPFSVFMITYLVYMFSEKRITWIVIFAIICRSVLLLIPNLKYVWFQGVAIDQHMQYRLTEDIYDEGYVPSGRLYSGTPLLNISFVIYSMISGVATLESFKYFPILYQFLFPLAIYLSMKNVRLTKNSSLLKYALIVSSIPVKSKFAAYLVMGTLFGPLLSLLILLQLIRIVAKKDRRDWVIAVIYMFTLVATHTYSSIMLIVTLLTMCLIMLLLRGELFLKLTSLCGAMALTVLNFAWLSFQAENVMEMIIKIEYDYIKRLMGFGFTVSPSLYPRIFELNFIDALKIILIYHGGDVLLLFLMLIGVVVLVKGFSIRSKSALTFSLYAVSLWLLSVTGTFLLGFGEQWYDRLIRLSLTVAPILSAISLFYINKRIRNTKLTVLIITLLMILASIELYGYQPLAPPARSISKDLPSDEPIVYVINVNSVYQRFMIKHAEKYIPHNTLIASDEVTTNQIMGLTNYEFSSHHLAWYYPLSSLFDESTVTQNFDYLLTHLPGKSGAFYEKAEVRTKILILKALYNSDIVYSNGESYMLARPFMYHQI